MLELSKKVLQLSWDGKVYNIKYPSVLDFHQVSERVKQGESDLKVSIELLVKLGLPQDVCEELDPDSFNKIISALKGEEKK